jgi:NIPSNAP
MLFVEATLKVAPGKLREFNELLKNDLVPLMERHGAKLIAAWGNLTGAQDVVTDLWLYDDLAHLQRVQESWTSDPAMRDSFKKLQTLSPWETTKLLAPLRYHPADALFQPASTTRLLMTARLRTNAGQTGAFLKFFQNEFLPVAQKHGMQLLGAFQTTVGPLSEILDLWRFDNLATFGEVSKALGGDPEFRRLIAEARALAPDEDINLHVPLPYSPYR